MSSSVFNIGFQAVLVLTIITVLFLSFIQPSSARRGASKINLRGTSELEARFFNDLKDQRLRDWSLADAFFIASGIRDEVSLDRSREWLNELTSEAREAIKPYKSVNDRADHLLRWLHSRVFETYRATSTDAVEVIRYRRYNCLSSCIVYGMIGEKLGLHIRGIAVDQHAFCRVYPRSVSNTKSMRSRSGGWDVETTTRLGFNPGRSVQLDQRVISVPRSRYRNRREISLLEMIGLIYTNHIGMTRAYPSDEDRLLAYQKASLFFPRDEVIQHNVLAAHTQVINGYASRRQWKAAHSYLEQLSEVDRQDKYASALWLQVAEQHLDDSSHGGLEEALDALDIYRDINQKLPRAAWSYLEGQLHGRAAIHLYQRGQSEIAQSQFAKACAAGQRAEKATRRISHRALAEAVRRLKFNHLVMVKNYIIQRVNQKEMKEAQASIKLALKSHPRDADLSKLQRQINGVLSRVDNTSTRRPSTGRTQKRVRVNQSRRVRRVRRR